jgi:hypothetical protein
MMGVMDVHFLMVVNAKDVKEAGTEKKKRALTQFVIDLLMEDL